MTITTYKAAQAASKTVALLATGLLAVAPAIAADVDVSSTARELGAWPAQTLLAAIAVMSMYFSFHTWKLYCAQNEKHTTAVNNLCAELRRRPCVMDNSKISSDIEV
jgi:hypothetical protein